MTHKLLQPLFWKTALYYGVLIALLLILVGVIQPEWLKYLPVGGLEGLSNSTVLTGEEIMLGQVLTSSRSQVFFVNAINLFSAMTGTLIVMIPLRWAYMSEGLRKSCDAEVASGLLLLPLVITAIVFCVKYSLPLAFALVGVLAGIRVRTELESKSDAHFTFASVGSATPPDIVTFSDLDDLPVAACDGFEVWTLAPLKITVKTWFNDSGDPVRVQVHGNILESILYAVSAYGTDLVLV